MTSAPGAGVKFLQVWMLCPATAWRPSWSRKAFFVQTLLSPFQRRRRSRSLRRLLRFVCDVVFAINESAQLTHGHKWKGYWSSVYPQNYTLLKAHSHGLRENAVGLANNTRIKREFSILLRFTQVRTSLYGSDFSFELQSRGSITVWLISFLTCLDLTKQVKLLLMQHKQSSGIQTKLAGGQPYSSA